MNMDPFGESLLQTKDGVMVADSEGKILMMNHTFEMMWKFPSSVIRSRSIDTMIHFVVKQARDPLKIIEWASRILGIKNSIFRGDFILKDGQVFNIHTFPMVGADNQIYGRVWYTHDVTEEKRIEDLRNLHGLIMENLEVGIILVKFSDDTIVYTNKCFEKAFGTGGKDLLGKHVSVLNLKKRGGRSGTVERVKKDGSHFFTKVKIKEIQSSEYGKVWVLMQSDIDRRV